ncbi:MAG: PAS domain S-box protein [Desulfobacteraceae bacterium]|nr:PAS domain S-box protein [Desulfobacteraceae bacterium]
MKPSILVLDDEESSLRLFEHFLVIEGYETFTANNYDSALTAIKENAFDLIIADIFLEDRSGMEFLEEVKKQGLSIPVVMVTGSPDIETASESLRLGAFDYISKPVRRKDMLRVVSKALEHKALLDEKFRLEQENEKYRCHLEELVEKRTAELEKTNGHLKLEITERKQAEKARQESEERFRAQYKSIPVPTFTWVKQKDDFVLLDYNTAAESFTKGKIINYLGYKLSVYYKDRIDIINDFKTCYEQKKTIHKYTRYKQRTTGDWKHLNISYVFVPPDLVMTHTEDITEQKYMEKEQDRLNEELRLLNTELEIRIEERTRDLNLARERLEFLIAQSPAIIYSADPAYEFETTFISKNLKLFHGHSPERYFNYPHFWMSIADPEDIEGAIDWVEDIDEAIKQINNSLAKKGSFEVEYRLKNQDGSHCWVQDRGRLVHDRNGNALELVGCMLDVTSRRQAEEELDKYRHQLEELVKERTVELEKEIEERKRIEQSLRESEDGARKAYSELDQIFNSAGDGMCLISTDFNVIRINRTLYEMFGWDKNQVSGKKCYELFSNDKCHSPGCCMHAVLSGQTRVEYDTSVVFEDGSKRLFSNTATPFHDSNNKLVGIVVNVNDITEKVLAREQARIREQQLIQADKLASLGILVSGVAHEINNPNGVIMLNAAMLSKFWKEAEHILDNHCHAQGDYKLGGVPFSKLKKRIPYLFEQLGESAKRIKRIVGELKDFARLDIADMSGSVDINDVVKTAVNLVSNKIKKSTGKFSIRFFPGSLIVRGNFQRLEQVFINVLINACESLTDTRQGISVTVSEDKNTCSAVVRIHDQGVGIDKEDLNHIFDPFFTTKRSSGGTGLGLSVTHGIIEEHNGKISFDSVMGKGTECKISLQIR